MLESRPLNTISHSEKSLDLHSLTTRSPTAPIGVDCFHLTASRYFLPADWGDAPTATSLRKGWSCSRRMKRWPTEPVAPRTPVGTMQSRPVSYLGRKDCLGGQSVDVTGGEDERTALFLWELGRHGRNCFQKLVPGNKKGGIDTIGVWFVRCQTALLESKSHHDISCREPPTVEPKIISRYRSSSNSDPRPQVSLQLFAGGHMWGLVHSQGPLPREH